MDLTRSYIAQVAAVAKAYDTETDMCKRSQLGQELDRLASMLSEGQIRQLLKMIVI